MNNNNFSRTAVLMSRREAVQNIADVLFYNIGRLPGELVNHLDEAEHNLYEVAKLINAMDDSQSNP